MRASRISACALAVSLALATASVSASAAPPVQQATITYADAKGHVHVVRLNVPSDSDISGGPMVYGTPTGYTSSIDAGATQEHVIYRQATGHLLELWKPVTATKWQRTDLRSVARATARAAGDVVAWSEDALGRQWIVYRATSGQIHGLTWLKTTGRWKDVNLSSAARTHALAQSDPTMYVDSSGATPRPVIVYRSKDKHVHVLVWTVGASSTAWHDTDVSKAAGFTGTALGKPSGWASVPPATTEDELHVVFRTSTGHVEELYGGDGNPWRRKDLTLASGATVTATGDVQGTVGADGMGNDFELAQYRGSDGSLHELDDHARVWTDTDLDVPLTRLGLMFSDGQSLYTAYIAGSHLWDIKRDWSTATSTTTDLTAATGATTFPATSTGGYFTP